MTREKPDLVKPEYELNKGLRALGLAVSPARQQSMLTYLKLLQKWALAFNLTAIRAPPLMVTHHLLDSLSAVPFLTGKRVLDVGSGAGFPGLPLAIALPQLSVTLIDSRHKRVQFLLHVVARLGLANVDVVRLRVEQYQPSAKFDTLVTRAFGTIAEFVDKAAHLCARDGQIIVWKGRYPSAELEAVKQKSIMVQAVHPVDVPGLGAKRHIVVLNPRDN